MTTRPHTITALISRAVGTTRCKDHPASRAATALDIALRSRRRGAAAGIRCHVVSIGVVVSRCGAASKPSGAAGAWVTSVSPHSLLVQHVLMPHSDIAGAHPNCLAAVNPPLGT